MERSNIIKNFNLKWLLLLSFVTLLLFIILDFVFKIKDNEIINSLYNILFYLIILCWIIFIIKKKNIIL